MLVQICPAMELVRMLRNDDLFTGRHFDQEIIILRVHWYLRFKLSFRDLVETMARRGISLAHTTILRWIQRHVPEVEKSCLQLEHLIRLR